MLHCKSPWNLLRMMLFFSKFGVFKIEIGMKLISVLAAILDLNYTELYFVSMQIRREILALKVYYSKFLIIHIFCAKIDGCKVEIGI